MTESQVRIAFTTAGAATSFFCGEPGRRRRKIIARAPCHPLAMALQTRDNGEGSSSSVRAPAAQIIDRFDDSGGLSFSSRLHGAKHCEWRTDGFYDQECSRYFDCPTHVVQRILSEASIDELVSDDGEGDVDSSGSGKAQHEMSEAPSAAWPSATSDGPSLHDLAQATTEVNESVSTAGGPGPSLFAQSSEASALAAERLLDAPASRLRRPGPGFAPSGARGAATSKSARQPASDARRNMSSSPSLPPSTAAPLSGNPLSAAATPQLERLAQASPFSPTRVPAVRVPSEMMVPRWQPDAEATYCPICQTQFSIFVRKHHCRKCGRVVCHACSPHRITIPYQYIVTPPGAPTHLDLRYGVYPAQMVGGGETEFGGLGGGERVRLCNPCVPDPNTSPPRNRDGSMDRGHGRSRSGVLYHYGEANTRQGAHYGSLANDAARTRSATMHAGVTSARTAPYPSAHSHQRVLSGTAPTYVAGSSTVRGRHYGHMAASRHEVEAGSSSAVDRDRRLPPLPGPSSGGRKQLAEEDECPVCHRELPARSLADFEKLREKHITMCVEQHSGAAAGVSAGTSMPPVSPRRTGMFLYEATEKDCVDLAECSICLEEFEEGVKMARLECLCRFHKRCIDAWWERHHGRCPMHQHDGFGF